MKVQRYDTMMITDSMLKKDSAGFLTVTAPITRPGVFPYQRGDGTVQMEAKLPDDVFSDLAIRSARAKPVTDGHPSEAVTIENINRYQKGMSHTDSRVEGGMLVVSMTITDSALMDRIFSGEQSEISIGFMSDIVEQRGMYNGDEYGYIQRNIDINHIAIVDKGRAGPQVAIRGDSDAWQIQKEDGGEPKMAVYKIDNKEYEVDPVVKSFLDAQAARIDAADLKVKDYDALQGRFDAQTVELNNAKKELKEAEGNILSGDELQKRVDERVALIEGAKVLLGDKFDFALKTDRAIKEAVILKVNPEFKADGKSDDYVNAFYDATVATKKQEGFSSTGHNSLHTSDGAQTNDSVTANRQARMNMKESK